MQIDKHKYKLFIDNICEYINIFITNNYLRDIYSQRAIVNKQ